jgi:nucleotidyltransferase/DNA polymerase involved in DNA repair
MQQQTDKIVIFFDMDCFYCQVESRRLGIPRDIPLVVDQWGFLLSVNYAAKAIGITRKTNPAEALKLGAVVAHVNVINIQTGEEYNDVNLPYRDRTLYKASLDRYREASEEVMTVMRQVLPPGCNFERASIDECYADISARELEEIFPIVSEQDISKLRWENNFYDLSVDLTLARGALLGERIRSEVFTTTQFTVSCGVSETRQVAKLSCSLNKPDKLTAVSIRRTSEFMRTVPLKEIRGLGPRAFETLQSRIPWVTGSTLCGELWAEDNIGNDDFGQWLYDALRGLNDNPIKDTALVASSVQASKQFRPGLPLNQTEAMLKLLCADMVNRLNGRVAKSLLVNLQIGSVNRSRQEKFPAFDDIENTVINLAYKTGLMTGNSAFDRIAVTAKDVDEVCKDLEEFGGKSKARKDVAEYLASSRLHFMGTWKTRYLQYMGLVDETGDWGDGSLEESGIWLSKLCDFVSAATDELSVPSGTPHKYMLVDMDCFFVSVAVSMMGDIAKEPAAVASGLGPTSEICSANYPARQFGISAGSFVSTARERCPQIQIFAVDSSLLGRCEIVWKKVIHVLSVVVGGNHEKLFGKSCDEALVDISGLRSEDVHALANLVQETVIEQTGGVPCSVGIGPSRILAKISTSMAKPRGVKVIESMSDGANLLRSMSVKSLPGVGYSTQSKLEAFGVETVDDLLRQGGGRIAGIIGTGNARKLLNTAQGIDNEDDDMGKEISTVSAEKNFGLRNLSLSEAADLVFALSENVISRLPPKSTVEKVILKLKIAGEDWVEPKKRGGIGDALDFSRSCTFDPSKHRLTGESLSEMLVPILKSDIDSTRIRGIGVSLKLKESAGMKRGRDDGVNTLDKWFRGGSISVPPPVRRVRDDTEPSMHAIPQQFMDEAGVFDKCIVCGDDILLGSLTSHFLAAHRNDSVCLCPICQEPIDINDTVHVASHFGLVSHS